MTDPHPSPSSTAPLTIVAVHGNGGGAHRFERVPGFLPPGVRLSAVTLPGFAGIPRNRTFRHLAHYAEHLLGLVAAQQRPRVLLGHGIGGSIALDLAQRHAADLDGLILHAPVGARLDRRLLPRLAAVPGARTLGQRVFAARITRPLFRRLLFRHVAPASQVDRFFEAYGQCAVFGDMFDAITTTWFRALRPVVGCPTALLWGERERLLPADQLADFRVLLPGALERRVPDWGHFPMIDRPAEYAAEIAALARALVGMLGEVPPPGAGIHPGFAPHPPPPASGAAGAGQTLREGRTLGSEGSP